MEYRKGTCAVCKNEDIVIVKRKPSGNYCMVCNTIRLNEGKEEKPFYHIPKKKKASGELILFTAIFETLVKKECEVCDTEVEFAPHTFSHILSKGSHPAFKLLKENISIMCFDCHYKWDNVAKSNLTGEGWDNIKARALKLKEKYNSK